MYGRDAQRRIEVHEQLDKRYTSDQVAFRVLSTTQISDFKSTGYSMLTPEQVDLVYGPNSPYNRSDLVTRFKNLTREEVDLAIASHIRHLARDSRAFRVSVFG